MSVSRTFLSGYAFGLGVAAATLLGLSWWEQRRTVATVTIKKTADPDKFVVDASVAKNAFRNRPFKIKGGGIKKDGYSATVELDLEPTEKE